MKITICEKTNKIINLLRYINHGIEIAFISQSGNAISGGNLDDTPIVGTYFTNKEVKNEILWFEDMGYHGNSSAGVSTWVDSGAGDPNTS